MKNAPWTADDANPQVKCGCSGSGAAGSCHVTHLKIYALDVFGEIPMELFQFTELMDLNLAQNVLSGRVPMEIGNLSKMQYLSLGINNLSGPVPPEFGNLSQLISLSFSSNRFSGPLPKELGKLTSLQQLYIDSSGVSGQIPQELENLKSLQILWASDNLFTGKLPEFIGTLKNLIDLRIQGTSLEGPIPSSFSALINLSDLRIGDLTVHDSSLLFLENLTSLSILSLRNSLVAGQLPNQLGTFIKLQYLDLSFNKLTGVIPSSFQNLKSLNFLYLGNNNITGDLPQNIITPKLISLDVSFNPISGSVPLNISNSHLSINSFGTSMDTNNLSDSNSLGILQCLKEGSSCTNKALTVQDPTLSINCGGQELVSSSGIDFYDDSETLGSASLYVDTKKQWAVSNNGFYLSNPSGPHYITVTDSQVLGTLDSELYKTARISPSSLRYFLLGLDNGQYTVDLHFAEIVMDDNSLSWKGLGRRLFDICIQGMRVVQDFNIKNEAKGSKRAVVKTFHVNVTNNIMDVHFFWAGRGTCCIPLQSTYGPLVSAIHVSPDFTDVKKASSHGGRKLGAIVGIAVGCAAGVLILSSILYLWWKKKAVSHFPLHSDSPTKTLV